MPTGKNRNDLAFREHTIGLLTKLDTQVTRLLSDHVEEQQEVRRVAENLTVTLRDHTHSDHEEFEAARARHTKVEKILNWGLGGLAMLQFVIITILSIWAARQ